MCSSQSSASCAFYRSFPAVRRSRSPRSAQLNSNQTFEPLGPSCCAAGASPGCAALGHFALLDARLLKSDLTFKKCAPASASAKPCVWGRERVPLSKAGLRKPPRKINRFTRVQSRDEPGKTQRRACSMQISAPVSHALRRQRCIHARRRGMHLPAPAVSCGEAAGGWMRREDGVCALTEARWSV